MYTRKIVGGDLSRFRTWTAGTQAIVEYIKIGYNCQRLHSALEYRTPAEVEAGGAA